MPQQPTTIFSSFLRHRDIYTLLACLALLVAALFRPAIPVKHNIYSYFFVVDITQSMNTADMEINGKPGSRLAHTKQLLHGILSTMPCGTKVGVGMFSSVNVVTLFFPIDVCANFSSIKETIDHMDWRSAWTADSRVREGILSAAQAINNFPEPAQGVFFTDGEEAPKLHAFNTRDLSTLQGTDGWLLVGIGSDIGGPIPRLDSKNQLTGYWSHESMQLVPGAAPIAAAGILQRKSDTAEGINDRYVSRLEEHYLQSLSREIGATYIRGNQLQPVVSSLEKLKPARKEWSSLPIDSALAALAGVLLLSAYIPAQLLTLLGRILPIPARIRHLLHYPSAA